MINGEASNTIANKGAGQIDIERKGPVGWVIINNPAKLNAMSLSMWQSLYKSIKNLADDDTIRVIVITGYGDRSFTAGADISEFSTVRNNAENIKLYEQAVAKAQRIIETIDKPCVANINGICMGGGIGIALACDLRFCTSESMFSMPAAKIGLGYDLAGVQQAVNVIGYANVKDLFFTARSFDGTEAQRIGFVNMSYKPNTFKSETQNIINQIAANAPLTIKALKRTVRYLSGDAGLTENAVNEVINECFTSNDYKEGQQAFKERRKPIFQGR